MKKLIYLSALFLGFVTVPQCFSERGQFGEEQVAVGDELQRPYWLYQPNTLMQRPSLVLVMHGYSGNAEAIAAYSGMNEIAEKHGFLVAYPQGSKDTRDNAFFNVGYEFHEDSKIDDVAYIEAIVKQILDRFPVKQDQIFATGMSNGGDMSYLLACRTGNLFRALAPVAGSMMKSLMDNCNVGSPPPILAISGTQDPVTRYAGDINNEDGWGAYASQEDTIAFWAGRLKVGKVSVTPLANTHRPLFYGDSNVIFERYGSSGKNNELWYFRIEGGGHDWPGARLGKWYYPARYIGLLGMGFGKNQDIDASHEIWKFFNYWIAKDSGTKLVE